MESIMVIATKIDFIILTSLVQQTRDRVFVLILKLKKILTTCRRAGDIGLVNVLLLDKD